MAIVSKTSNGVQPGLLGIDGTPLYIPNGKELPHWTAYDSKNGCVQELGDQVASKPGLFRKELEFLGKQTSARK